MKKFDIPSLLFDLASPVAMILAGLVLTFCPDMASAVVARLLGWAITLVGIGFGIAALVNRRRAISLGVTAVGLACIGGFLTANPLVLAAFLGRIIGVLIALRGIREAFLCRSLGHSPLLAGITLGAGAVLTVLPMTASRLVFTLCGVAILVAGVWMLLQKIRDRRLPPGRPDIIDV